MQGEKGEGWPAPQTADIGSDIQKHELRAKSHNLLFSAAETLKSIWHGSISNIVLITCSSIRYAPKILHS